MAPLPAATMDEDTPFNTGMDGKLYLGKNPVKVTEAVLTEGHGASIPTARRATIRPAWGRAWFRKRWPAWQPQN